MHALGQNDEQRVRVFVFLGKDCPISRGYLPALNRLYAKYSLGNGVDFFGVASEPAVTRQEAERHYQEFKTAFPVLFDASLLLVQALKPTHVPEAFVLDRKGNLIYRGAIDNAYLALNRRRPKAEEAYLADAITAAQSDRKPEKARTQPVGCVLDTAPAKPSKSAVTYTRDIAPILQNRCVNCHRTGQAAPFTLTSYEDAVRWAKQMVTVTEARLMPPWMPAPGHERFVGERWLTDRERLLLAQWERTGRTRGNPADLPPPPRFAEGWRLGKPDLVVRMPDPFTVPAEGPDILHNFVIPIDVPEDKLVAAIEFHPGNTRIAHHAVLFLDRSGTARKLDAQTPEPGYSNFSGPGFLPTGALGG
ncbi:MAG: hypothetical protein OHK0029_23780 [Armatimonadaceae bacterium]